MNRYNTLNFSRKIQIEKYISIIYLLIEFMVVELFKCKGKMSAAPQVEITADHPLERGKCTDGGHQQFLMNNSSDDIVWQFSYGGFNGIIHLLIEFVVVMLFKCKGKMSDSLRWKSLQITSWRGGNAPVVDTSNC